VDLQELQFILQEMVPNHEILGNKHLTLQEVLDDSISSIDMRDISESSTENIILKTEGEMRRGKKYEEFLHRVKLENVSSNRQNSQQIL
jgi:hypothetical protein